MKRATAAPLLFAICTSAHAVDGAGLGAIEILFFLAIALASVLPFIVVAAIVVVLVLAFRRGAGRSDLRQPIAAANGHNDQPSAINSHDPMALHAHIKEELRQRRRF